MTTIASHQQIISKADAELSVLARQEQEATATIAAIDAEQATIHAQMEARATQLTTLFETGSHLQSQYDALIAQEKLAEGTLQEGKLASQIKAAGKEKDKSAKALATFEGNASKADKNDEIRLQALAGERLAATRRLEAGAKQRTSLEQAKTSAIRDMGLDEFRDITFQLDLLSRQITARKSALEQAEQELADFASEAKQRLTAWPEHLAQVKQSLPYQDEVTHVLEAAIALYGLLLTEGPRTKAKVDMDLLRQVHNWASNLSDLLALQDRDLWPVLVTGYLDEARTVRERKAQIEKLLELYRREKR